MALAAAAPDPQRDWPFSMPTTQSHVVMSARVFAQLGGLMHRPRRKARGARSRRRRAMRRLVAPFCVDRK